MTEKEIDDAFQSLPEEWKEVVRLPDRDRAIIIICNIVRLYKICKRNEDLAITAFNA
jgi:hypothetical protein